MPRRTRKQAAGPHHSPLLPASCTRHCQSETCLHHLPQPASKVVPTPYRNTCRVLTYHRCCCAVLCRAVPCRAVLCCAVLWCAVPCCAVPCCVVPCRAVPCCAMLCCADLNPPAMEPYCRDGGTPSHPVNSGEFKRLPGWDHQLTMCNTECERAQTHARARSSSPRPLALSATVSRAKRKINPEASKRAFRTYRFQRHVEPEWF
eukprot:COSAG06_NODE_6900_length_2724_cov_5.094857_1_plen_204_part_00